MTLKNKLLSAINSDIASFTNYLKSKKFTVSNPCETSKNIIFMKRSDNFVCFMDFLYNSTDQNSPDLKYGDIIFHLYERTENGYKAWNSMYGSSSDKEAVIIKQLIEF